LADIGSLIVNTAPDRSDRFAATIVPSKALGLSVGKGEKVIAIDIEGADIETRSGSRQRFYRK
jgi:hypothetical protein